MDFNRARTNYFHVTDEDKYAQLYSRLRAIDSEIYDFSRPDKDGRTVHCFGADGEIGFPCPNEDGEEELNVDVMVEFIRELLPDDECFTYMEIGSEGMEYVDGYVIMATKDKKYNIDLLTWVDERGKELGVENHRAYC